MKSFYSLFFIRRIIHENSRGSVILNISNTIKMFNTTHHISRFLTRNYNDTVGIHHRKFTRKIQIVIRNSFCQNLFLAFFTKHLFKIKYKFLYRISLNTWVLLMVFNEILTPQDSFTETNVTRKRVRRRKFIIMF